MLASLTLALALSSPMTLVGEADLRVLFWPVYQVSLYSPDGRYHPDQYPLVLSIDYQRNISNSQLLKSTQDEWQRLGVCQQAPCEQWLAELAALWPDVKKGDQLRFVAESEDKGVFFFNGQRLGEVEDSADIAEQFLAIWLSPQARFPKQRRELLGMR
ncbi:chalcone isomerase family protein [Aliagarivorans marinus]|uniref:chalcone isomerase family protein n=1 Tax=Aliagarivorans marinus TaxID=561965 RepID=UPI00040CAAC3|nr:chalcone isomerase family protein [Aliagarivorans marinus]